MDTPVTLVAVASDDLRGLDAPVGQHFGRCAAYTLVDVVGGEVGVCQVVQNPFLSGHQPGDVPGFIAETRATVLLAGGIGHRAIAFFEQYGIRVSSGHTGTVRDAVEVWLSGTARQAEPCSGGDHASGQGHGHGRSGDDDCGRRP